MNDPYRLIEISQMNTEQFKLVINVLKLNKFMKKKKAQASWRRLDMREYLNWIRHSLGRNRS